jgi:hypothetical protein
MLIAAYTPIVAMPSVKREATPLASFTVFGKSPPTPTISAYPCVKVVSMDYPSLDTYGDLLTTTNTFPKGTSASIPSPI